MVGLSQLAQLVRERRPGDIAGTRGRWDDLVVGEDELAAGVTALATGAWAEARAAFEAAWAAEDSAEALDGLGQALWWLDEPSAALEARSRAFALFRRDGQDLAAVTVALWLAREYRNLFSRHAMADGWLARSRSLLEDVADPGSLAGWLLVAESEASEVGASDDDRLIRAVAIARRERDTDLEIVALARRGCVRIARGEVSAGASDLHEAMVAATAGEGRNVQYVGEALCSLLEAAGWLGDPGMVEPWAELLVQFRASYAFGPLVPFESAPAADLISAFCASCCGGIYLVTGRLDAAEEQLVRGVYRMTTTGLRPRCLHPVAQLAELRVLQGRLEEAEATLTGFEDDRECAVANAALHLAGGQPAYAVQVLTSALATVEHTPLIALPIQVQLLEAALTVEDVALARSTAADIAATAAMTGTTLHRAQAGQARGRLALLDGEPEAERLLHAAARDFAQSGAPLQAARTRVALARTLLATDRGLAITEARSALNAFERMGAAADADRTAAFLRGLGDRARSSSRSVEVLSRREQQVLALLAQGLTNAEIAERLVISVKTVGHHVSSILLKLGLRSRTEAAAFALLRLPRADTAALGPEPMTSRGGE
jgi:DNA-binding NarL/FixJ family response regulator